MRFLQLLIAIISLSALNVYSQNINVKPYINAFKVSDTSQTRLAEEMYAPFRKVNDKQNLPKHQKIVDELYRYLNNHPDDRLEARIVMFDVLCKISYKIKITDDDLKKVRDCIKLAYKLKDDQLKSELFSLYAAANYWDDSKFLLYNFKAILIQQKLGIKLFSFNQNRYFSISCALYRAEKYQESISYGMQSLQRIVSDKDSADYIFQCDVIGASYMKEKNLDSAMHYYQKIQHMLGKYKFDRESMYKIWTAIAKGRIGQILIIKGYEKQGLPMVKDYLNAIKIEKDTINIAIGENILANVNYNNKHYLDAIKGWRAGYYFATKMNLDEEQILALKGMAMSFNNLNKTDSAFKYFKLYEQLRDKRRDWLNSIETEKLKSEMSLEDLKNNIEKANLKVDSEKLVRNFILAIIFLLSLLAVLVVKKRLNDIKNQKLALVAKQQETEKQMLEARKHVEEFSQHILEKDRIIYDLSKSLKSNKVNKDEQASTNPLLKYILVTDQEMAKFRVMVADAYPGFFIRLENIIENITAAEERLASLICLKLNDRQMASMLGISKDSVARSKRRLKQRLTIPDGETLEDYIYKLATWYDVDFNKS